MVAALGAVIRNQGNAQREPHAESAAALQAQPPTEAMQRQELFDVLQPVALANCRLERFGEANDGGYLMCANLLGDVQSGYSYGISGYDQWGCDISSRLEVPVHQYDCFNTTEPACPTGNTIFHAECVGPNAETLEGRRFDGFRNHFASNGDASHRIVLKIDVEGAEWLTFLAAPDEVLEQIDQLAVEFHWSRDEQQNRWIHDAKYLAVVRRLKQFFEIAHLHFNNFSCVEDVEPFPGWAYEALFVNKRLAVVDPTRTVTGPDPLDAPNDPLVADCQPAPR